MKKNKIIFGILIIILIFFAINTKYGEAFMHINKSITTIFKCTMLIITLLTIFFPSIFESDLYIDMRKGKIDILPNNPIILSKNIKENKDNRSSNFSKKSNSHNSDRSDHHNNHNNHNNTSNTSTKYRRKVSESTKKYVASKQKWRCLKCDTLLDCTYEIDHIKPLYLNGTNDVNNLQALCRNCHGKKTTEDRIFS